MLPACVGFANSGLIGLIGFDNEEEMDGIRRERVEQEVQIGIHSPGSMSVILLVISSSIRVLICLSSVCITGTRRRG